MEGEQGAAGDAEILAARLAAEPERTGRTTAFVNGRALAVNAHNATSPAQTDEGCLGFFVRHTKDRTQGERPGLG